MKIAWVGLGSIGTQMVKRLLGAGHEVQVYQRGAGLDEAIAAGAQPCTDYCALVESCDVLVLCVYNDEQVREVLLEHEALASMPSGSSVVIHTTGSPALAQDIQQQAPANVSVLDACFSGGPDDVKVGQLTIMVGGNESVLEELSPLLGCYAHKVYHVGPLGHGQKLKLFNNLLFATNLMNASHLLTIAEAEGFDSSTLTRVMASCSGDSYALKLFSKPAPPSVVMQSARPYLEKDVTTALESIRELGLDVSAFEDVARFFKGS